jgi:hypothetical protein
VFAHHKQLLGSHGQSDKENIITHLLVAAGNQMKPYNIVRRKGVTRPVNAKQRYAVWCRSNRHYQISLLNSPPHQLVHLISSNIYKPQLLTAT